MNCTIPANPDISGIGVRTAIYAQNLLSFVPAIWALMDGKVTDNELHAVEAQSVTILITAFAILISTVIQAQLSDLSTFHAAIVLNLSWMNNTNTFIYFLLYIHHKSDPDHTDIHTDSWASHLWRTFTLRPPPVALTSLPALTAVSTLGIGMDEIKSAPGYRRFTHSNAIMEKPTGVPSPTRRKKNASQSLRRRILRGIVFCLGSLHLTLMSSIGLWVWSDPRRFELLSTGLTCTVDNARISVFGHPFDLSSDILRHFSLAAYSLILAPGVNMLLPVAVFLAVHLTYHHVLHPPDSRPSRVPAIFGMCVLLVVDLILLMDNEISFRFVRHIQDRGESDWTFGQILALLLLCLPARDIAIFVMRERNLQKKKHNTRDLKGAIERVDLDEIRRLVNEGANIHIHADTELKTVFQVAALKGDITLVKHLLRKGEGYVDPRLTYGNALFAAVLGGHPEIVDLLLCNGGDPDSVGKDHQTPLHIAATQGNNYIASRLLDYNAKPALIDANGCTPIDCAASHRHDHIVGLLVRCCADTAPVNPAGDTVVHIAAREGNVSVLSSLLKNGASPAHANNMGHTPLHLAASSRYGSIIRMLLQHGAPVNATSSDGQTPLQLAAQHGSKDNVQRLLQAGADVDIVDNVGQTALHHAVLSPVDARDVVPVLIEHKVQIDAVDKDGQTALHLAVENGKASIVWSLLTFGSDKYIVNTGGETALAIAERRGHELILQILNEQHLSSSILV